MLKQLIKLTLATLIVGLFFANPVFACGGCEKKGSPDMLCPMQGMHDSPKGNEWDDKMPCPKDLFFRKIHFIFANSEKMNLSEDQISSLWKLKIDTKKKLIMKEAEIEVNEEDMKSAMMQEDWSEETFSRLIDSQFDLKG